MIDAIPTMLATTLEAEYRCWISAINAVTAFRGVEEGRPTRRMIQSHCRRVPDDDEPHPFAKRHQSSAEDETEMALRQAMEFHADRFPKATAPDLFSLLREP